MRVRNSSQCSGDVVQEESQVGPVTVIIISALLFLFFYCHYHFVLK